MNAQLEQSPGETSQSVPKLAVRDAKVSMLSSRLAGTPGAKFSRRLKLQQFGRLALSPALRRQSQEKTQKQNRAVGQNTSASRH